MTAMVLDELPEKLQQKMATVLGLTVEQLGRYELPVLIEELCDSCLMAMDPQGGPEREALIGIVRPVVKTANSALGPWRIRRLCESRPRRLVIGASAQFPVGWVATEANFLDLVNPMHWRRFFTPGALDAILAEHVWEHLSAEQADQAARICHHHLRPGGYVRAAVPDGLHPDPVYIEAVRPEGTGPGAAEHCTLYTYKTFAAVFERAGFEVTLLEHFDEAGQFHAEDWDPLDGYISRSARFDARNTDGQLNYTSIVVDAKRI